MPVNIKQNADGTTDLFSENLKASVLRLGGGEQPIAAATVGGLATFSYHGSTYLKATVGALGATAGGGAILNPYPNDVLIGKVLLNLTAVNSGATLYFNIGTGAATTAFGNNLFDAFAALTVGAYDNITNKGTAGGTSRVWTQSQYITMTNSLTPSTMRATVYIEVLNP